MKKRFLAAMMAVLLLCGTMTPALAVEEVPASEEQTESVERAGVLVCPKCDKGTFYTYSGPNGSPTLKQRYVKCPVNPRYNCDIYVQEYIVCEKCSVCGYEYNIRTKLQEYWVHCHA